MFYPVTSVALEISPPPPSQPRKIKRNTRRYERKRTEKQHVRYVQSCSYRISIWFFQSRPGEKIICLPAASSSPPSSRGTVAVRFMAGFRPLAPCPPNRARTRIRRRRNTAQTGEYFSRKCRAPEVALNIHCRASPPVCFVATNVIRYFLPRPSFFFLIIYILFGFFFIIFTRVDFNQRRDIRTYCCHVFWKLSWIDIIRYFVDSRRFVLMSGRNGSDIVGFYAHLAGRTHIMIFDRYSWLLRPRRILSCHNAEWMKDFIGIYK